MGIAVEITAKRVAASVALASVCAFAATHGTVLVSGGSMLPAVSPGDLAVFRRGSRGLAEGSMAVFQRPGWGAPVVHRVVRMTVEGDAVTRGDANPVPDLEPVEPEDVRGRVVAVVPTSRVLAALALVARDARLAFQSHIKTR